MMNDDDEENEIQDDELERIERRLIKIHENQQISMCCIIILLSIIMLLLWFSPTF